LPGRQDLAGDVTAREIGPYVLGVIGGDEEDDEDPRGNLGGMVDVDFDDPIVGRRGNLEEALPPHLQSKVDAYEKKKQKFSIIDRTPPGYGPDWEEPDEEEDLKLGTPKEDPMGRGSKTSDLRKMAMRKEHLRQIIREEYQELMAEVTAGAEKFADFEAIAQAYRADKTDRKAVQEMVYYVEDVVSPEMENLGLRDTATDSAKRNGLFDWSAPKDEDYKNASIDLYGDGYEVEVYPSSNDDDMQTTTTETLMDAIKFVRGVLSPEGAVAPGEDPAQMELPLQENRKIKIRRKKK